MNSPTSQSPTCHLSFSRHLCTSSLHRSGLDAWRAGYYLRYPFSSHTSSPLNHQIAASLHTSFSSFLPDKQKPTVEKAVDIAKEKKKIAVVDTLTKVPYYLCKIKSHILKWQSWSGMYSVNVHNIFSVEFPLE